MPIKNRIEILKEWGVIRNSKDLEIYRKLQKTSTKEKELKYGRSIVSTVLELIEFKETNQVRRAIKRIASREKRILIGDLYLTFTSVYLTYQEKCEHRLVDVCSETQKDCTFLNCPELQSVDREKWEEEILNLLPEEVKRK